MEPPTDLQNLCSDLSNSILRQLQDSTIDWSSLSRPHLIVQVVVQDGQDRHLPAPSTPVPGHGTSFSHQIDLSLVFCKRHNGENTNRYQLPTPPPTVTSASSSTAARLDGTASQLEQAGDAEDTDSQHHPSKRRKMVSSLRPARSIPSIESDDSDSQRQMQVNARSFPKRRPPHPETPSLQATTLDKFIIGVWEGIHGAINITTSALASAQDIITASPSAPAPPPPPAHENTFTHQTRLCRRVTQLSRTSRALEVAVQARWTEHFAAHVSHLAAAHPHISPTQHHKRALVAAAADFGWSEKELRNRMAIWQGYKRVKDAAGWVALVFAGMGFYRFCKYRVGLDREGLKRLEGLRGPFEVAADTVQPRWREVLVVVLGGGGEGTERVYTGHPHDWVVGRREGEVPVALAETYRKWDENFRFAHVEECVLDEEMWGGREDPRWVGPVGGGQARFFCETCAEEQSDDPKENFCRCFPGLFGAQRRMRAPVQVFRTPDGRNNGLAALCPFERGAGIGEFVGLITQGLRNLDVMECEMRGDGATPGERYQIWQGKMGNFTRFVNHSCKANAQFQRFVWRGKQRVVLTSKGIPAGAEITVDYSGAYWKGLDKHCLCGEGCCRYPKKIGVRGAHPEVM